MPGLLSASEVDDGPYLLAKPRYDPNHPEQPGFQDPRDDHSTCFHAYYRTENVVHAPHLLAVANRSSVLEAVEAAFGCKPTLSQINIWWLLASCDHSDSYGERYRRGAEALHRDLDDWAQVKLFIYLTDVDARAAAHVFLKGSHRGQIAPGKRNLEVKTALHSHPGRLQTITGPAGTAWLENTFGLHLGKLPQSSNRLILAMTYSLFPLPFNCWFDADFTPTARRPLNPSLDPYPYDHYINRLWIANTTNAV